MINLVKNNFMAFIIGYSSYEESIRKTSEGERINIPLDFLIKTAEKINKDEDAFLNECVKRAEKELKNADLDEVDKHIDDELEHLRKMKMGLRKDEPKKEKCECEKEKCECKEAESKYGVLQGHGEDEALNIKWYVYLNNDFEYTIIVETKDKSIKVINKYQGVKSIFGSDVCDTEMINKILDESINKVVSKVLDKTKSEIEKEKEEMDNDTERTRGFEVVKDDLRKYPEAEIKLPKRGSFYSSCYDICIPTKVVIKPHEYSDLIFTDICAYMKSDEVLMIHVRSSLGIKRGLVIANTTPIIDADYYFAENGGNIGLKFYNRSDKDLVIEAGERVCQGMFVKYLTADNDECIQEKRTGGIGHTGTK